MNMERELEPTSQIGKRSQLHRWFWLALFYSIILTVLALTARHRTLRVLEGVFANLDSHELVSLRNGAGEGLSFFAATMVPKVFLGILAVAVFLYSAAILAGGEIRFGTCLDMSAFTCAPVVIGAIVSLVFFLVLPEDVTPRPEAFDASLTLMIPRPDRPNFFYSLVHKLDLFMLCSTAVVWWLLKERTSLLRQGRFVVLMLSAGWSWLLLASVHWASGKLVFTTLGRLPF